MQFSVFNRYKRRRRDLDAADIGRLFLNCISTRKLKGIVEGLYAKELSAQTVSNVFCSLDRELERFKHNPISDTAQYLFLDGITHKIREIGFEKKVMPYAYAIHRIGPSKMQRHKEILSSHFADVEDEASSSEFLAELKLEDFCGQRP